MSKVRTNGANLFIMPVILCRCVRAGSLITYHHLKSSTEEEVGSRSCLPVDITVLTHTLLLVYQIYTLVVGWDFCLLTAIILIIYAL